MSTLVTGKFTGGFFLWHLKLRLGKKSPSADRVAAAHDLRGRLTPPEIYE